MHIAFHGHMFAIEKWDCPEGYDEVQNMWNKICKNMFKCKGTTNTCLHLGNTCDGSNDCPFGDDELFCHLQKIQCPSVCNCLLYAIECQDSSDKFIVIPYPQIYLFIFFSYVEKAAELTANFINALFVLLPNNFIKSSCNIAHFPKCLYLNVKQNIMESISKNGSMFFHLYAVWCLVITKFQQLQNQHSLV